MGRLSTWAHVAELAGVSVGTARRVAAKDRVTTVDNAAERERRQIARPSKADAYREVLVQALAEQPAVKIVRAAASSTASRPRRGKGALYALAPTLRRADRHSIGAL